MKMRIQKSTSRKVTTQKCSFTHPVLRSMTAHLSVLKLEDLPNEMLLHILSFLHLPDLLSTVQLNTKFKQLIESTKSLWCNVSLAGKWPSPENMDMFERVAEAGNVEAKIKLAQAYLYKEGVSEEKSSQNYEMLVGRYFSEAENSNSTSVPFTWLFIRPPWSTNGTCRKAKTFLRWKKQNRHKETLNSSVLFSMAKIQTFLEDEEEEQSNILQWYQQAADQGLAVAKYHLWKHSQASQPKDAAHLLESIRQLREIAAQGCLESQVRLYSEYTKGNFGDLSRSTVTSNMQRFFQSSRKGVSYPALFNGHHSFTNSMRYILLDWLVEVATLKEFSSQTIHLAVSCVDRYLSVCSITRCQLQLVGITCMLICARLEEDNIITIREAAWLTDGTYKYEEVVRMMGDVVATLRGNLKQLTALDYLELLVQVDPVSKKCEYVAKYIAELSLLHSYFGTFRVSVIAASCLLLARVMTSEGCPWSSVMTEFSGFGLADLSSCCLALQKRCFEKPPVVDHRDVALTAVKQRFAESNRYCASSVPAKNVEMLHTIFACEDKVRRVRRNDPITPSHRRKKEESFLLMSPSRKSRRTSRPVHIHEDAVEKSREEEVVTPTHEVLDQEGAIVEGPGSSSSRRAHDIIQAGSSHSHFENENVGKQKSTRTLRSGSCRVKLQDVKNRVVEVGIRSSPRSLKRKTMES
ncbi:Cyclin-F [Holothuria leucospilota]|uniref:Cyclin-F n=1 Tax=Holothuria leucospilota TaxID=206669 RepID=A0A9Q1C4M1_HOLLE|nr:Cyclin-F [Holothuria leucospilota]